MTVLASPKMGRLAERYRAARAVGADRLSVDEAGLEATLAALLEAGRAGPPDVSLGSPGLAGYSGRGPLKGFVGISAQRLALCARRRRGVEARAVQKLTAIAGGVVDAELVFLREQYKDAFAEAFRDALQVLNERQRVIVDSVARLMASQIDISLSSLL